VNIAVMARVRQFAVAALLVPALVGVASGRPAAGEASMPGAVGLVRQDDLGGEWFETRPDTDPANRTPADDVGLSQIMKAAPWAAFGLGLGSEVPQCFARRVRKTTSQAPYAGSPVFRVPGVVSTDQLATVSYQSGVTTFPDEGAAAVFAHALDGPGTLRCVKQLWREQFFVVLRPALRLLGSSRFVREALHEHTKIEFTPIHTVDGVTQGLYGSYITRLSDPNQYLSGSIRIDNVQIGRYVATYAVASGRKSFTGDGDPGIDQAGVDEQDKAMNAAAHAANDRLRAA
jgi:hypothetical protein